MANIKLGGTTAITESSGTVTLDNAVQDNITRLGTVTAGNLSNTAIVYPVGHIIQMSTVAHTYTQTSVTSQTLADWSGMSITITPSDATNKIIICGHLCVYSAANDNLNCLLFRDDGGGFDALGGLGDYIGTGSIAFGDVLSINWVDTPSVTVQCTYKIQMRSDSGGQCYIDVNDGSSSITHQESSNSWMYAIEVVA